MLMTRLYVKNCMEEILYLNGNLFANVFLGLGNEN